MTAVTVITTERIEPGILRDGAPAPAHDMTRGGIGFSAALHLGVLILIAVGLPSLFHHRPPEETPIAVDLVLIAPETRATAPNPYRPKPDAKPELTIAAPAPKPEPKPEPPKPVPEPPTAVAAPPPPAPEPAKAEVKPPPAPSPPPPKPIEAQAPPPPPLPRPPEPKPKPEIRQVHQQPPAPTAKADPAAFDKLLKNLEQPHPQSIPDKIARNVEHKRPEPAAFDALLQNLTKEQAAEADDAPPAPHRVAATAPPSSQPKAPLGSQLSASDIDLVREKLRPCFNPPFGAKENPDLVADIRVVMNSDGTVQQARIVDMGRYGGDQVYRALADSGIRALKNPQCSPLPLPADRFDLWKTFTLGVSTRDMQ